MSEKLLKILVTELMLVRVRCLNETCQRVVEVPIDKLEVTFKQDKCPLCNTKFEAPAGDGVMLSDHLRYLAGAIQALKGARNKIEVSFVLPDPAP